MAELEDIQTDCLADDIEIVFDKMSLWDEATVRAYFENGGQLDHFKGAIAVKEGTRRAKEECFSIACPMPPTSGYRRGGSPRCHLATGGEPEEEHVVPGKKPTSRALRWAVDISKWDPTPAQWMILVSVLTEEVRTDALGCIPSRMLRSPLLTGA